jgi:hypothetical protein
VYWWLKSTTKEDAMLFRVHGEKIDTTVTAEDAGQARFKVLERLREGLVGKGLAAARPYEAYRLAERTVMNAYAKQVA